MDLEQYKKEIVAVTSVMMGDLNVVVGDQDYERYRDEYYEDDMFDYRSQYILYSSAFRIYYDHRINEFAYDGRPLMGFVLTEYNRKVGVILKRFLHRRLKNGKILYCSHIKTVWETNTVFVALCGNTVGIWYKRYHRKDINSFRKKVIDFIPNNSDLPTFNMLDIEDVEFE